MLPARWPRMKASSMASPAPAPCQGVVAWAASPIMQTRLFAYIGVDLCSHSAYPFGSSWSKMSYMTKLHCTATRLRRFIEINPRHKAYLYHPPGYRTFIPTCWKCIHEHLSRHRSLSVSRAVIVNNRNDALNHCPVLDDAMKHSCPIAKPGILAIDLEGLISECCPGLLERDKMADVPPTSRRRRMLLCFVSDNVISDGTENAVCTNNSIELSDRAVFESDSDFTFCLLERRDALSCVENVPRQQRKKGLKKRGTVHSETGASSKIRDEGTCLRSRALLVSAQYGIVFGPETPQTRTRRAASSPTAPAWVFNRSVAEGMMSSRASSASGDSPTPAPLSVNWEAPS